MSAKRKAGGSGNGPNKRRPKKQEIEEDFSEASSDEVQSTSNQVEVLIPNDDLDPPSKLPEDLLLSLDKTPGKLLIAGMVTWDLTGKRDRKNVVKVRPNLYNFHRFSDEKVGESNVKHITIFSSLSIFSTAFVQLVQAPLIHSLLIWIARL